MTEYQNYYKQLIEEYGTPLLVLDEQQLLTQYQQLSSALPKVKLFYALKAFTHPSVISALASVGAGFDVASCGEIEAIRSADVSSLDMIHTHPIKTPQEITRALRYGCTTFVVDNVYELEKFVKHKHRVGLLLRLSFHDQQALVNLSDKFGCMPDDALWLLRRAKQLGLHIKGLSFHVGSQAKDPQAYVRAIEFAKQLTQQAEQEHIMLSVLDIGGGFPVNYQQDEVVIHDFCAPIVNALEELPNWVQVWAEPGRFLIAPAVKAFTKIIGKARKHETNWYYLDDGVYGSFSGQIYDGVQYPIQPLDMLDGVLIDSVLAGPTCDGIDIIQKNIKLPELQIGDILMSDMMGAYTAASASRFNSLAKARIITVNVARMQRSGIREKHTI